MNHFAICLTFFISLIQLPVSAKLHILDKGHSDPATYAQMTLDNGLRVLLISDARVLQSVASMTVGVGYYDDPDNKAGAAHLLEHVLSKGSRPFPSSAEYKQFLAEHGGASNASTSAMNTNYYFYVNAGDFDQALARFSAQFYAANLEPKMILREANAVESEFRLKYKDNYRKYREVTRRIFDTYHPYRKFSTGNLDTLVESNPKQTVLAIQRLYEQFYFAENMSLVLFGPQSIENLANMARARFSSIKSGKFRRLTKQSLTSKNIKNFSPTQINKLIKIKPEANKRRLTLNFLVPGSKSIADRQLTQFLRWLLNSQQKGGLESVLEEASLITKLTTNLVRFDSDFDLLSVEFELTKKGMQSADEIVSAFYDFLSQATEPHTLEITYELYLAISNKKEKLKSSIRDRDDIRSLSKAFLDVGQCKLFPVLNTVNKFDIETASNYFSSFSLDKLLLVIQNPDFELGYCKNLKNCNKGKRMKGKVEPIYNTPYLITELNWKHTPIAEVAFELPKKPRYWHLSTPSLMQEDYPRNYSPSIIKTFKHKSTSNKNFVLGLKDEQSLQVLKLYWDNSSVISDQSLESKLFNQLLLKRIEFLLEDIAREARDSFISIAVDSTNKGFYIKLKGNQTRLAMVLEDIFKALNSRNVDEKHQENIFSSLRRSFKLTGSERLSSLFDYRLKTHFNQLAKNLKNYRVVKDLKERDYQKFEQSFFSTVSFSAYGSGLIDLEEIESKIKSAKVVNSSQVKVNKSTFEFSALKVNNVEHKDHGVLRLSKSPLEPVYASIFTEFLAKQVKAPFFHQLRTQQQLGYRVSATAKHIEQLSLLSLYVQSPQYDAGEIIKAINDFSKLMLKEFSVMTNEEFLARKRAFKVAWLSKFVKPESYFEQNVTNHRLGLPEHWYQESLTFLDSLTLKSFVELANHYLRSPESDTIFITTLSK